MRIIFLGDSLTWGGYGGNFVDVVTQLMPEHDIINAGVGGDTAINIERRLGDELDEHQPDAAKLSWSDGPCSPRANTICLD